MSSILKIRISSILRVALVAAFASISSMGHSDVIGESKLPKGIALTEKSPAVLKLVDDMESRLENLIENGDYVDLVQVAVELKQRKFSQANTFISLIKSLQTDDGHLEGCARQCALVERLAQNL